jgi:Ca2+-binding RTX toxin-like protein
MAAFKAGLIADEATTGDDVIQGFAGNDILAGGTGNDTLVGGAGADRYAFNVGDGIDTVQDGGSDDNAVFLGVGIAPGDVRLVRTADNPGDLHLVLANGTDQLVVAGQFLGNDRGVARIVFADGTIWSRADLPALMAAQPASVGDDYIVGSTEADSLDGLAGNDTIFGQQGDDVITGSAGNDHLYGGIGNDTLSGGDGDDVISGDEGLDQLDGGNGVDTVDYSFSRDSWSIDLAAGTALIIGVAEAGTETITGFEAVVGGLGSDHLSGSDDANTIQGGAGDDVLAGRGGDDIFLVDGNSDGVDAIDGGGGFDSIKALSDDTQINLSSLAGIERITADGHSNATIAATDGDDVLDFGSTELVGITKIILGAGNDRVTSSAQADVFDLGDGDDTLIFGVGSGAADTVDGGAGNDRIEAGADHSVIRLGDYTNIETISGAGYSDVAVARSDAAETTDLTVTTTTFDGIARFDLGGGDDHFIGGAGADTAYGQSGNDHLEGRSGDDILAGGIGNDTIDGGDGNDTVVVAGNQADFILTKVNGVLTMTDGRPSDGDEGADQLIGIENIQFADGLWDSNRIAQETRVQGDDGANSIIGTAQAETLVGGKGNDYLEGRGGSDIYRYASGDGNDTIVENGSTSDVDVLKLTDLNPDDILLARAGSQLTVIDTATGQRIAIQGQFQNGPQYGIEQIDFADGSVWTSSDLIARTQVPVGLSLLTPSSASFTYLGSALQETDGTYRLTPNSGGQLGAMWSPIDLSHDVRWTTRMFFGSSDGGADGITFALQATGTGVTGGNGVLASGTFGISFDTYTNSGEPSSDFSIISLNGQYSSNIDTFHQHANLETNSWHNVVIEWNAETQTLGYSLDGTFVASGTYDLATMFGSNQAYFGFGARTGGATNYQAVDLVSLKTGQDRLTADEDATGGTLLATLKGIDFDPSATLSYSLTDASGTPVTDANFEIVNGNELRLTSSGSLSGLGGTTVDLFVEIQDQHGASKVAPVFVDVDGGASPMALRMAAPTLADTADAAQSADGGVRYEEPTWFGATLPGNFERIFDRPRSVVAIDSMASGIVGSADISRQASQLTDSIAAFMPTVSDDERTVYDPALHNPFLQIAKHVPLSGLPMVA